MDRRKKHKQPIQPIDWDGNGVIRFKPNAIVEWMLERGRRGEKFDLNTIAIQGFSQEDEEQLAQLIGYSVSGFADLSFVSNKTYNLARKEADRVFKKNKRITKQQMNRKAKLMKEATEKYLQSKK